MAGVRRLFARRAWQHPRSIVVIKPCCIGDLIMTTPLLEVLRTNYPHATITYVAGTWSKTIAEHHPAVDAVIDCGTVGIAGRYRLREYFKLALDLRRLRFDLAFVLDRSPMVTFLSWLAGIPRRVGPDSLGRGFALTDRVPVSTSRDILQHQADIYLELPRALDLTVGHPRMRFVPTEEERQSVVTSERMQVTVFPGGGSNPGMQLTAKRWPQERYRDLILRLVTELDVQVLLIGGREDQALNALIMDGLDVAEDAILNLAGKTSFGETAAQIERSALFIGNDSSPMHLAAAVDTPVIAIFGPTSPQEYGPYPLNSPHHIALWRHPTGQPCFFLGRMQNCDSCNCMQVTVDDAWEAVQYLLAGAQKREVPS
jgi:lipopolysaccharide heptosyltransferase II